MVAPTVSWQRAVLPVYAHLRRLPFRSALDLMRRLERADPDDLRRHAREAFGRVLRAALVYPTYRALYGEGSEMAIDPDLDLRHLPTIDKATLHELTADARVAGLARDAVQVRRTGGSTGRPGIVYADRREVAACLAARRLAEAWFDLPAAARQLRLWGRRPDSVGRLRRALRDLALNRVFLSAEDISARDVGRVLRRVISFDPLIIYGYSSLLVYFLDLLRGAYPRCPLRPRIVVATSEVLLEGQRRQLADYFGCPVATEYGCSEVDIIATTCPAGGCHVIAPKVHVEVVRFGGEPEGLGEVVVTDLQNTLMPLIRYRTGDLAPLDEPACECGRTWPCLGPIQGRVQGQYVVRKDGTLVHSQNLVYVVEDWVARGIPILQYFFHQRADHGIDLLLVPTDGAPVDVTTLGRELAAAVRATMPEIDTAVRVVDRDRIERFRENKHRHFLTEVVGDRPD